MRLALNPQVRAETLPLDPQEYFVLSRVEGQPSVGEIIGVSGLGPAVTEQILEKLLELGALARVEAPARPSTPTRPPHERRARADERRRTRLRQQLAAQVRPPAGAAKPQRAPTGTAHAVASPPPPPPPEPEPEPLPDTVFIEPVPGDDARLDPSLGLAVYDQRVLLAMDDRRQTLSPYEFLGLAPTDDLKAIRAAFRDASRRFHPDAYHGRSLGSFGGVMSRLFVDAKAAYGALQRADVRAPLVAEREAELERRRQRQQQRREAAAAAEALARNEREAEAAQRRAARAAQRAERERERINTARRAKVAEYLQGAAAAEGMENFAAAANNYRLALQIEPEDQDIRARWESTRAKARRIRAKDAYSRACSLIDLGHASEATPLLVEAAQADPTTEHLAHAADAVRDQDPVQARELAMAALRAMGEEDKEGKVKRRPTVEADLRLMIGRAFLAAGQSQSARQQAVLAQRLRPSDPKARALLKSAKVT